MIEFLPEFSYGKRRLNRYRRKYRINSDDDFHVRVFKLLAFIGRFADECLKLNNPSLPYQDLVMLASSLNMATLMINMMATEEMNRMLAEAKKLLNTNIDLNGLNSFIDELEKRLKQLKPFED